MLIFTIPINYSKLCKLHVLCPKGVHLLNAYQLERYRTSKKSSKFLNKIRYIYLELQYFAIEKSSSKLKKKKVVLIDSTNQTFIIYKNSCEQKLSDDVTQSYVIKMCVRKTNIGLIWVKKNPPMHVKTTSD